MLIKVNKDGTTEYPYTASKLKKENPDTSFPSQLSTELMESFGVFKVTTPMPIPEHDFKTHIAFVTENPELVDGSWVANWEIVALTKEEKENQENEHAWINRNKRAGILDETDHWGLLDTPKMTMEQTAYRQALRDITSHSNWPYLEESDWPTKP
jgi:hypothetical protein